jgi:hypothetical protein
MGNVFFGKQLLLATMGVAVAERLRESGIRAQNIETANAIEALACWLTYKNNNWTSDPRLRGVTKMRGRRQAPSFAEARKRSFYVTQPMRMSTVQPLLALGFVDSESGRFNAFRLGQLGRDFLKSVCEHHGSSYYSKGVFEHLVHWASQNAIGGRLDTLTAAISPLEPLPEKTRGLLRELLVRGDDWKVCRRRSVLAWLERVSSGGLLRDCGAEKPPELDEEHWRDLEAGAKFFETREVAINLLDEVERLIGNVTDRPKFDLRSSPELRICECCDRLAKIAQEFLGMSRDPSPEQQAMVFCRECLDGKKVIENIVKRDGRVLRLSGQYIIPGPAFRGAEATDTADEADAEQETSVDGCISDGHLPPYISRRVGNMLLMSRDLHGKLGEYLKT